MSNSLYQFYRSNTLALCGTLVVKHSEVAVAMNTDVVLRLMPRAPSNTPNPNMPAAWKYYLNLAGKYHRLDKQDIRAINIKLGYPVPPPSEYVVPVNIDLSGTLPLIVTVGVTQVTIPLVDQMTITLANQTDTTQNGDYTVRVTGNTYSLFTINEMVVFVAGDNGPVMANFNVTTTDTSLANEYRYGSAFYSELVSRYPNHEHLILGILNPVDIQTAIAAKDGDILYCGGYYRTQITDSLGTRIAYIQRDQRGVVDNGQIEPNESNLIEKIQTWIKGMLVRWHNPAYARTDDLYMSVVLGNLILNLPAVVMNARLENCLTPMAHSYHVREYLESHGQLAKYIPALPLEQTLFLYRNVRWIQANAGKQETFNLLLNRLVTPTKVPLSGFRLRHKVSGMPSNLLPETIAAREIINFRSLLDDQTQLTVRHLLKLESPLAVNNPRTDNELDTAAADVQLQSVVSDADAFETKLIESAMLDVSDRLPFKLSEVLLNHWIYCASQGTYKGTIYYTHPVTGDRLHITPRNAAVLFLYALARSTGIVPVTVPTYRARLVPRATPPSLSDMHQVVDSRHVSDEELTALTGTYAPIYTFKNANDFYEESRRIHQQLMQRYFVSVGIHGAERQSRLTNVGAESYLGRAMLERCLDMHYLSDAPCHLADGVAYADWFHSTGIDMSPIESLTAGEQPAAYQALAAELLKQATGGRTNTNEALKALQEAVMSILQQFSSYSVQYVHSINNWDVILVDPKPVRIQYRRASPRTRFHITPGRVGLMDVRSTMPAVPITRYNKGQSVVIGSTVTPPYP